MSVTPESRILRDHEHPAMTLGVLLADAGLTETEARGVARHARICSLQCQLCELADVQRRAVVRTLEARDRLEDPIAVGPFVEWCDQWLASEGASLDATPPATNLIERLMLAVGWEVETGARKLWRWRHPHDGDGHSGFTSRALIEDALDKAGVDFDSLYPDNPHRPVRVRLGENRRMTDDQVLAAHKVYVGARMSTLALGELLHERYGYASGPSCARSLLQAFHGLGLPVRQCVAMAGDRRCKRPPVTGDDHCPEHRSGERPSHKGGRASGVRTTAAAFALPSELVALAREMHVGQGMSFRAIGRALVSTTPLTNPEYLAYRVADVAAREGWHQSLHLGRPRGEYEEAA